LKFRNPDKNERTRINRALDRWGAFEFFKDKSLLVTQKDDTKKVLVWLVSNAIEKLMIPMTHSYSLGLAIGELRKEFVPTIAGADLFARYGKRNKFYVVLNEKAEKLVLYGRDIMGESVVEASTALAENELVILLNSSFDALGIGRTRFSGNSLLKKGRVTFTTITDAGYYLREEG
jgi:60S ribosome subunit biogenesis protein NIP7